jgi:hypothetical protein
MERDFKITIPKPCHENWDTMTPRDNGRFCMSCSKTVVDFTTMLPDEVQHFFIQNKNTSICGRFKKSQLDTITIQIPSRVLYTQTHYSKMFLLALFIAMGTTLFSCADKDGNKKKIDKIEVVQDVAPVEQISVGKSKISTLNDTLLLPPPPPKVDQVKFVKPLYKDKNKKAKINYVEKIAKDSIVEDETIFMGAAIETSPCYSGGISNFYDFFIKEFKLPEGAENFKAPIIVSFVIGKDGSLSSFNIPKETDPQLEAEIIRVLKLSPKWIPGEQNGKKTSTKYSLEIISDKKLNLKT